MNTDRHFGFIDALGQHERVFFHLSEVLPDGMSAASGADQKQKKGAMKEQDGPTSSSSDAQGGTGSKNSSTPQDPSASKGPTDAGGTGVPGEAVGGGIKLMSRVISTANTDEDGALKFCGNYAYCDMDEGIEPKRKSPHRQ